MALASSLLHLPRLHSNHHKSLFLGQTRVTSSPKNSSSEFLKLPSTFHPIPAAKFSFFEIMGGRGLCNGEVGLQKELKRTVLEKPFPVNKEEHQEDSATAIVDNINIPEDAFNKELLGFTGGFPGGEKGLQKFIEKNPPPKEQPGQKLATDGVKLKVGQED